MNHAISYRLVYDAASAGYTDWWFPTGGAELLAIFSFLLLQARREGGPPEKKWIAYAAVPFLTFWVIVAFAGTYGSYATLRDRLAEGRYVVVEGAVQAFQPNDAEDHREESWQVESGGRVYAYHYVPSMLSPGFRQTAIHGGPIREGLQVRIADIDGHIARLEVAR